MEASALASSRRCSWCGTLNANADLECSKCGAVFSSSYPIASSTSAPAATVQGQTEDTPYSDQDAVRALVDSSMYDEISGEAMRGLGLGPTFVSNYSLAFAVAACLALFVLISLGGAVVDISQIQLLSKSSGLPNARASINDNVILALVIRLLLTGVVLFTSVFFLIWIYRAHKNLKALGSSGLKYSPGWAVGGFFIPVLNLFRPYQVVSEIWKASSSTARRNNGTNWQFDQTPAFISVWWGLWIVSGFLDLFGSTMIFGAGQGNAPLVASRYHLVYDVVSIACAALAMMVVFKITARQEATNRANQELSERSFSDLM